MSWEYMNWETAKTIEIKAYSDSGCFVSVNKQYRFIEKREKSIGVWTQGNEGLAGLQNFLGRIRLR